MSKNWLIKGGDETTVYLLADGRYMDRINAVYIYDGKTIPRSKISWVICLYLHDGIHMNQESMTDSVIIKIVKD